MGSGVIVYPRSFITRGRDPSYRVDAIDASGSLVHSWICGPKKCSRTLLGLHLLMRSFNRGVCSYQQLVETSQSFLSDDQIRTPPLRVK